MRAIFLRCAKDSQSEPPNDVQIQQLYFVHGLKHLFIKIKVYRTIILLVVWYGCETWSLKLREECRLRVSENRVLRRIFGLQWDEVTGACRKLHG